MTHVVPCTRYVQRLKYLLGPEIYLAQIVVRTSVEQCLE